MKRFLIIAILALLPCLALRAQDYRVDNGSAQVDSSLVGRNVLSVMGSGVSVNQSRSMRSALDNYVANNASKKLSGFRIRVYFDNGQSARTRSEAIFSGCKELTSVLIRGDGISIGKNAFLVKHSPQWRAKIFLT